VTVVVGFVGTDGAVMASDTEGTEADQTRRDVEKIWRSGTLLFGYSGTSSVQQPLRLAIEQAVRTPPEHPSRWEIRASLCAATAPVLQSAYDNFVPRLPPGNVPIPLVGTLLAIGHDEAGFWLLEVDRFNSGSFYTDPGFHAIGSGSAAAQVARGLLGHYEPLGRGVRELRLIAYRTVATCISVLGGALGVGGDIVMWEAAEGQPFAKLPPLEVEVIEDGVAKWTTIERESLDRVFADEEAAEAEDVPLPEPLDAEPEAAP
jgi:hypothetical protein